MHSRFDDWASGTFALALHFLKLNNKLENITYERIEDNSIRKRFHLLVSLHNDIYFYMCLGGQKDGHPKFYRKESKKVTIEEN